MNNELNDNIRSRQGFDEELRNQITLFKLLAHYKYMTAHLKRTISSLKEENEELTNLINGLTNP